MTTGKLLKYIRVRAGFSQETMASLLHRTQSCISKIESGRMKVDIETFVQWTRLTNSTEVGIAFLYGVDPAQIIQMVMQVTGAAFGMVLIHTMGG